MSPINANARERGPFNLNRKVLTLKIVENANLAKRQQKNKIELSVFLFCALYIVDKWYKSGKIHESDVIILNFRRATDKMSGQAQKPDWIRPPGPLQVWKIIDGYEVLPDGTCSPIKISIQDIPPDRHEEVLEVMCTYFLNEDPIAKSLRELTQCDSL